MHEVINPLSRRTGTAAKLIKTAVRIMTVTRQTDQEEINETTTFYQENVDKVTEMVQNGLLAVGKVHAVLPELGRLMFYHDEVAKQAFHSHCGRYGPSIQRPHRSKFWIVLSIYLVIEDK